MPATLPPVDPNVTIPQSVKDLGAAADAAHRAAYPQPENSPQPDPPAQENSPQPNPPQEGMVNPQPAPPSPPPAPPAPPAPPRAPVPETGDGSWEHRYLAMKGRFDQSQTTIGTLQEQLSELGDELNRTIQHQSREQPPKPPPARAQPVRKNLTEEDVNTYGPELLDVIQRAARDAVAPDLSEVTQQVRQTSQRVSRTTTQALYGSLDENVPTWRAVNVDPRFKSWCHLRDVYSGELRGKLLNAAFQAADAPRVAAFFQAFLREEEATGQAPVPPAVVPPTAPRQAAVSLEALAAPGRPKPAGGDSPTGAAEKPVFTRAQISQFYAAVRKGAYVGRDADKQRDEAAIFAAQAEGRVR